MYLIKSLGICEGVEDGEISSNNEHEGLSGGKGGWEFMRPCGKSC